jgi:hypothetical protein
MLHSIAPARRRPRVLVACIIGVALASLCVSSGAYAEPAGGIFPLVLRDPSCKDVGPDQSDQATECDPNAPGWTEDTTQTQQVVVTQNVDAPGSAASASQDQDAPVTQLP